MSETADRTEPVEEARGTTAFTPPPANQPARVAARYVPPHPSAVLEIRRGPQVGQRFEIRGACVISIGRHAGCDIVLTDVTVSRRHAEIHQEHDRFTLVDGGSLNGTYLNQQPVADAVLADGDDIAIGVFRLTFHSLPADPASPGD